MFLRFKRSIIILSIFTVASSGCSNKDGREVFTECSESIELTGERMPVSDSLMMGGFVVRCLDDNSAVIRYFGRPFILGYLSLKNYDIRPFVYSGRGPGEMLEASDISYTALSQTGHRLIAMSDINVKKHIVIDIDESLASGVATVLREITTPANTWNVFPQSDGFLFKVMDKDGFSYKAKESDDGLRTLVSLYPQSANKYYNYLASMDCICPNGDKIVMCLGCLDKIYILDLKKGSRLGVVTDKKWRKRDDLLEAERQSQGKTEEHYMYACCDSDYIYALYSPGNELRVFDWKGHFVHRIHLDHPLLSISITPSLQLYGTDMEEGLFRYDLSSIIVN